MKSTGIAARRLIPIILLAVLAGCTSNAGRLDTEQRPTGPSVISIVNRLRCEIGGLARRNYQHSDALIGGDFVVVAQLNLSVNDDGSLAPSFIFTSGVFSFSAGLKLEVSREQNYTQNLVFSIKQMRQEIERFAKVGLPDPYPCDGPSHSWLDGDLGIKTVVNMAFETPSNNFATKGSGTSGAFGGYVNFTITKNLNGVGPTWTLKNFKGPGGLAGVSELNTDKLAFAFAQSSASGELPKMNEPIATNANAALDRVLQSELAIQLNSIRLNSR